MVFYRSAIFALAFVGLTSFSLGMEAITYALGVSAWDHLRGCPYGSQQLLENPLRAPLKASGC